ncbi:ADYC domain-containing protein [Myxococcus fulvus]|uniref:ADYC domain-containing protein n=1 Tax=Myxococcus fulvus TaxID=33 RepID=UPI003B9B4A29
MSAVSRLLSSTLCLCLLAACEPVSPGEATPELASQDFLADGDDSHSQGTQLHGTSINSFFYDPATVLFENVRRPALLRVFRGELAAKMPLAVSGTTASLSPCFLRPESGAARSCGLSVKGQGVCTPDTVVTLDSGECSGSAGSCTGRPVLRVCAGEKPCEHARQGYLGSSEGVVKPDPSCALECPSVQFTCPKSGIFTVLAGPYFPGQPWSASPKASGGRFPVEHKELRGKQLIGTQLRSLSTAHYNSTIEVVDAINAAQVTIPESPGIWDASGSTFLYRVKVTPASGATVDLCRTGVDPTVGWAWAVPLEGYFNASGARQESTTSFTLGCDPGVLAKCYRWGYKPWLDGASPGAVTKAHWACTRMARADYCGNGTPFTQDGTPIQPWDALTPNIITAPQSGGGSDMRFEAGWDTSGPACLSHWRWKHLQAGCVELQPPIEDSAGNVINDCRDPHNVSGAYKCSPICDNAQEAAQRYKSVVFNNSRSNEQLAPPQP